MDGWMASVVKGKEQGQGHSRSQSCDPLGQRLDPRRWPRGSQLWEREWGKGTGKGDLTAQAVLYAVR